MIESRVLRAFLILALLGFAAMMVAMPRSASDPPQAPVVGTVLALLAVTFAAGLAFPGRRRIALRIVAGSVVAMYLAYFGIELWQLAHGEAQSMNPARPSALSAGLGLLIWGVPLFIYAFSGATAREHAGAASAPAADPTGEQADRVLLELLASRSVDLTRETPLRFFLVFPTEGHAESAAAVLRREGHRVELSPPAENAEEPDLEPEWEVAVFRAMVPEWDAIRAARARYDDLASALGGRYAGWLGA